MSFDPSKFNEKLGIDEPEQPPPHGDLTPQQAENTRMAYSIMWGIPWERIDLDEWRERDNRGNPVSSHRLLHLCNTTACIAGWLSAHPHFKAQGLSYDSNSGIVRFKNVEIAGDEEVPADEMLFGDRNIFDGSDDTHPNQKLEALERLRLHLFENNAVTYDRYKELEAAEQAAFGVTE